MDTTLWIIGRATGVVSLGLLTLTVVLGIITRSGRPMPALPRFSVQLVHRNVSLGAAIFVVVHVLTLLLDSYAKIRLIDLIIPFIGIMNPIWQGLGTVAFDLMIAVVLTSLLRHRIGLRTFRFVHWFSYAMWPIALIHGIGNGTDRTSPWFIGFVIACIIAVAVACIWRLTPRFIESAQHRTGPLR